MKKLILVAFATVLVGSLAIGQQRKSETGVQESRVEHSKKMKLTPEQIAQIKTDRLNEKVGLTNDQKKQVKDIFLLEAQEYKGKAVHNVKVDQSIKAVLNQTQIEKYEAEKATRRESMKNKSNINRGETKNSPAGSK